MCLALRLGCGSVVVTVAGACPPGAGRRGCHFCRALWRDAFARTTTAAAPSTPAPTAAATAAFRALGTTFLRRR